MLYLPGLALISATSSLTVPAGNEGLIESTVAEPTASVTGAKFDGMIGNFGEHGRVHDMRGVGEQDGVAVGRAPRRLTGADVSAATTDILDVELPAEMLGQLLGGKPREHVGQPARREWNDDPYCPCRITLCPRDVRCDREHGSTRCQMQKSSAGNFHDRPSSRCDRVAKAGKLI